jgi:hypothetical protein
MRPTLDFIQIIYNQEQFDSCYPWAQKYFNTTLTDYFENDVISKLVPTLNADYISVCSWRLAKKRPDVIMNLNGELGLTEDRILSQDFDIAVLTPRSPRHKALEMASHWHGEAWDDAFTCFRGFLYDQGVRGLKEVSKAIYENHFIARREIYHDYVKNWLIPAIAFMEERDVFRLDSGYIHKKRDPEEIKNYQEKSGRTDWPIGVFILERLFSIYIEGKPYKIINL